MAYLDEIIDLENAGDTGDDADLAIQPVGFDGAGNPVAEYVTPATFNRVTQNLRRRGEITRRRLQDVLYLLDYDRGLSLWSVGSYQLVQVGSGPNTYRLVASDTTYALPTLSPGVQSGGRARGARLFVGETPYAGVAGVNDLAIVASAVTTGQRGYADGDALDDAGVLSLGGNNIYVEVVGEARAGGQANVRATVTGSPRRRIRITYGTQSGGTTVGQLVAAINADANLFGTEADFGLSHLIRASTTSDGSSTSIPNVAETKLRGAFDAEGHIVTSTQMTAFFDASSENLLRDGEGLAIGFPAGLVEAGTETFGGGVWQYLGGRRQSLFDAPTDRVGGTANNTGSGLAYGNLFNTGRQPELIPNAIPLGKLIGDEFVFVDGTRLKAGQPATSISESFITVARIAQALSDLADATPGSSGAMMVGYGGSDQWHVGTQDDGVATLALPGTTVEAGLDAVVTQLSSRSINSSGARRVGAEAQAGSVSTGNAENLLSLPQHSVRGQLAALLNATLNGRTVGINARVNESGHRLVGADPVYKNFAFSGMPASGAEMLRAELHAKGNVRASTPTGVVEHALSVLAPFSWTGVGDDYLGVAEGVDYFSSPGGSHYLSLTDVSPARHALIRRRFPVPAHSPTYVTPVVVVKLSGLSGCIAKDGFYLITSVDPTDPVISLEGFNGVEPNFENMDPGATATFYNAVIIGGEPGGTTLRIYHYNGTRSFAKVGLGDANQPFLDLVYSDGTDGNLLGARFYGNKAEWSSTRRTAGGAANRNTENILTASDKTLLDGVETGAPVDASASHHHDPRYDGRYIKLGEAPAFILNSLPNFISGLGAAGVPVALNGLTAWKDYAIGMSIPGFTVVAVELEITFSLTIDGTYPIDGLPHWRLCSLFGIEGVNNNNNRHSMILEDQAHTPEVAGTTPAFTRRVVVPVLNDQFAFRINTAAAGTATAPPSTRHVNLAASTLYAYELGVYVVKT